MGYTGDGIGAFGRSLEKVVGQHCGAKGCGATLQLRGPPCARTGAPRAAGGQFYRCQDDESETMLAVRPAAATTHSSGARDSQMPPRRTNPSSSYKSSGSCKVSGKQAARPQAATFHGRGCNPM